MNSLICVLKMKKIPAKLNLYKVVAAVAHVDEWEAPVLAY